MYSVPLNELLLSEEVLRMMDIVDGADNLNTEEYIITLNRYSAGDDYLRESALQEMLENRGEKKSTGKPHTHNCHWQKGRW